MAGQSIPSDTPGADGDVLVVGAGPVGLTMAWALAHHGVRCRIVDRGPGRSSTSKALVLWSRTLETLDALGGADAFVAAGIRGRAFGLHADGSELVRIDFARIQSPYPYALLLPQYETERLLEERLADFGVEVERGTALTALDGLDRDADAVLATLERADGRPERVRARWLVACDGAHSSVRHLVGAGFTGGDEPDDWALADVEVEGPLPADELGIWFHPDGLLALFPIGGRRFRVIANRAAATGAGPSPDPTIEEVRDLVATRGPGGLRIGDAQWLAAFRIHERQVADYRPTRRVFLAGDAAHVHGPAGGQGMNTGMQDAFNLAWKLALVARARGRENPLLDSYSAERQPVGARVIRDTGLITRVATLRGALPQRLRSTASAIIGALAPLQDRIIEMLSEVGIRYPDSPLSGEHHRRASWLVSGPPPGDRMPDALLVDRAQGQSLQLHALLREPAHRLFLFAGGENGAAAAGAIAALDALGRATAARYPGIVSPAIVVTDEQARPPAGEGALPVYVDSLGLLHLSHMAVSETAILVRPDGYIGFRGQPAERDPLWRHLDRHLVAA